jgi:hypothetical protein
MLPFLLVRKIVVGIMAAFIGSPHHLVISASEGISKGTSRAGRSIVYTTCYMYSKLIIKKNK